MKKKYKPSAEPTKERRHVSFRRDLAARLDTEAKSLDRDFSWLVNHFLDLGLKYKDQRLP